MILPVQKLLALLPPPLLDRLAVQYAVNAVNQVRLSGQAVFLCLLNALVNHPKLTQRLLEETYTQLHGHTADHSSFGKRLEQINPEFPETDVALVIGANDVTNPAARNDPQSPIYGMPILDVDKAEHVVVLKRSMNPGFAGIDNALYTEPQTVMLFGDAKDSVTKLIASVKEL